METVRTTHIRNPLTAELNRLARTDSKALYRRVTELLQSTEPVIIARFENAMQDSGLNLGIVRVVTDCKHELQARVLLESTQGPTRQGVQNLMAVMQKVLPPEDQDLTDDEESAGSEGEEPLPTGLAGELYELLDLAGKEGVKQRVRAIFTRNGVDVSNLNESNALGAALDYFRREGKRDPSGKAAIILKIIEENCTI